MRNERAARSIAAVKQREQCHGISGRLTAGSGWIIIGLLAGGIAKLLMPGKDPGGCIVTILLGIAGALLAGFLGQAIGWYSTTNGAGFIAAIVGAFIILLIYRLIAPPPLGVSAVQQSSHRARAQPCARCLWLVGGDSMKIDHALPLLAPLLRRPCRVAQAAAQPCSRSPAPGSTSAPPAKSRRVPDVAIISAGVVTRSADRDRAPSSRMRRAWSGSARRCSRAGIDDKDIQTSSISLNPDYRLRREPAAEADRLSGVEQCLGQVPRHPQDRRDPRRAGRRGRQPDQRPEPDHRQARGGAGRGARQGDRRRPGARRALCPGAGHAGRALAVGQRKRRLSRRRRRCRWMRRSGWARGRVAKTTIDPGTQDSQVSVVDELRASIGRTKRAARFVPRGPFFRVCIASSGPSRGGRG